MQGETKAGSDSSKGHNRAFTYGETNKMAEWCAEIYWDVNLVDDLRDPWKGYSRVLIGAPIWVRTPTLRDWYLYSDYQQCELEQILSADQLTDEQARNDDQTSFWQRPTRAARVLRGLE